MKYKRGAYKPKEKNIILLENYLNERIIKKHKKGVVNNDNR